ncbi:MAG TPA: MBL fold metallo-hydrolase [Chitinophagaceae bacterium]|nr:MBL fold metallo-hydrolase [Chitinophagaceae bacterium]
MFFEHIYDKTLAQGSYIIGCQVTNEAIVIDPKRDISDYLEIAKREKLNITHITETHIHADFLSGARELAKVTGGKLYLSDEGGKDWQYEFDHIGLKEGSIIKIGNLTLEVMHTPGHTPESITFILRDHPASDDPVMAFTGDFVFVGDVGRPDLLEKAAGIKNTMQAGASDMYDSIQKFSKLPDFIQIWPGHGAGSACGKSLGSVPSSTLGYEKTSNWAFRFENDKEGFINFLLSGQPEPPKYFAMMKHLNKVDRPLLTSIPELPSLTPNQLDDAIKKGIQIIDTRDKFEYDKASIKGSWNIQNNKSFANWMGWMMNYKDPFIIISSEENKKDITRKLMSIGLDNVQAFYTGSLTEISSPQQQIDTVPLDEFIKQTKDNDRVLLDIRNSAEFEAGHIENAQHVFVGYLADNLDKISRDKPTTLFCQAGDRATIGYSFLLSQGFTNIEKYVGGMGEWRSNNLPVTTE